MEKKKKRRSLSKEIISGATSYSCFSDQSLSLIDALIELIAQTDWFFFLNGIVDYKTII